MGVIRNLIQKEKIKQHNRIQQNSKINEMRITQNLRETLHFKRQKSL